MWLLLLCGLCVVWYWLVVVGVEWVDVEFVVVCIVCVYCEFYWFVCVYDVEEDLFDVLFVKVCVIVE